MLGPVPRLFRNKGRGGRFVPLLSPPEGHPPLWELWSPTRAYIIICSKDHKVFKNRPPTPLLLSCGSRPLRIQEDPPSMVP